MRRGVKKNNFLIWITLTVAVLLLIVILIYSQRKIILSPERNCIPFSSNNSIPPETRVQNTTGVYYCDPITLNYLPVKNNIATCRSDFECSSNSCINGKCKSVGENLNQQTDFLKRIFCTITNPIDVLKKSQADQNASNNNYLNCIDTKDKKQDSIPNQERSAWLQMDIADQNHFLCSGFWFTREECGLPGQGCSFCSPPPQNEISNAVGLLKNYYNYDTVYLVYYDQFNSTQEYKNNLQIWKDESDKVGLKVVPSFSFTTHATHKPNFNNSEVLEMVNFSTNLLGNQIAVIGGNSSPYLQLIKSAYPNVHETRLSIQPSENPGDPHLVNVDKFVEDTWTWITACYNNTDWSNNQGPVGWTRQDLKNYVTKRNNQSITNIWNQIAVGWPYEPNESTSNCRPTPVKDDAILNDPVPIGRNILAAQDICSRSNSSTFKGFSNNLMILEVNSMSVDSTSKRFMTSLKNGVPYTGKFSAPMEETKNIFNLKDMCDQTRLNNLLAGQCSYQVFNDLNNTLGLHYNSWYWISAGWKTVPTLTSPWITDTRFTCLNGGYYNCNFSNETVSWTTDSTDCQKVGNYYCDYTAANWVIKKPSRCA